MRNLIETQDLYYSFRPAIGFKTIPSFNSGKILLVMVAWPTHQESLICESKKDIKKLKKAHRHKELRIIRWFIGTPIKPMREV